MKAKSIIPTLKYNDAKKAIQWLCEAFGFEEVLVVPGENDLITHAQLAMGNCMIMLGSIEAITEYSQFIKHPKEIGGFQTQSPYIVLAEQDMDDHYKRVQQHGAKIAMPLRDEDYGGKLYACYDLEGYLWNFGSYDPFA